MKEFDIFGDILDTESQKCSNEDICVSDFKKFVNELTDSDTEIVIDINSCGGSVPAGISIANMIKQLSKRGIRTIARIDGYACSIASVIACACDEIQMGVFSFMMIHNAWSTVQGNSNDLRKEADVMDQMNEAIISFYVSKFGLTHDELKSLMDEETWISPADIDTFKLNCTVLDDCKQFEIAAKYVKEFKKFNNAPKIVQEIIMKNTQDIEEVEKTEEVKKTEEVEKTDNSCEKNECVEEVEKTQEEKKEDEEGKIIVSDEDTIEEEVKEEITEKQPTVEELQKVIDELKKKIQELEDEKQAPVEERVSGMQSKMQAKINTITVDFKNQIEVMSKELDDYKNQTISLKAELDKSSKELQTTVSALQEKENALAVLNANVNTPEKTEVDYRKLHGKEFFDWLKKNNIR